MIGNNYTWVDHETKLPTKRQERPLKDSNMGITAWKMWRKTLINIHAMTIKTEILRKNEDEDR